VPERPQRVTIGFPAGGVLAVRIAPAKLDKLLKALSAGGWHELAVEDGQIMLDLGAVAYVRVESDEQRVGF